MSTAISTVRGNESPVNDNGFLGNVQGTVSNVLLTATETDDMSPRTRRIVYISLLAGVLFLASVAAYVWYGYYQWQNIP
jgi:TRAP-type C4-dicarboxylate transport system permease small subunit